jgi:hypothetical protein
VGKMMKIGEHFDEYMNNLKNVAIAAYAEYQ